MFNFFIEQNEINNWYIFEVKHKSARYLIEHKQSICCGKFRKNSSSQDRPLHFNI